MEKSFGDRNPVMHFIDYECYDKVNITNMRPMPTEFSFKQYPIFALIGGELLVTIDAIVASD